MEEKSWKKIKTIVFTCLCCLLICGNSNRVYAIEHDYQNIIEKKGTEKELVLNKGEHTKIGNITLKCADETTETVQGMTRTVDARSTTKTYYGYMGSTKIKLFKIVHTVVYNYNSSTAFIISSTPVVTLYNSKGSYTISKNTYTKTPNALAAIAIVVIDYYNAMYGNAGIVCDAEVTPAGNFTGTIKVLY